MRPNYSRGPTTSVTDIERLEMAHELLETAKEMQVVGLKRILGNTIKNPLIPYAARAHAERAYGIACSLEQDLEWRQHERKLWMRLKRLKASTDPEFALDKWDKKVPIPEYMMDMPTNLQRALDYQIAQVGMIAGELVYKDIIAQTSQTQNKPSGGVFRHGQESESGEEPGQD